MAFTLEHILNSIAGKLIVILGILIVLGSGSFWYMSVHSNEDQLMDDSILFLASLSEMLKRSIRQDMITVNRDHIQMALENISGSESVDRIQLFNADGKVVHSSDREKIGVMAEKGSSPCTGCHMRSTVPDMAIEPDKQWAVYEDQSGRRILSYIEPVYNSPDCSAASCHVHTTDQKVLGVLMTDFSLSRVDRMIKENRRNNSLIALAFLIFSTFVLYIVLWRFVLRPVKVLSKGMENVISGDLTQKVAIPTNDEIGKLADTFNEMTGELSVARKRMMKWAESLEEEVIRKTGEIRKVQDKLIQAEKLAALGRMTADVAHEIRNPLTALGGFGRRLEKIVQGEKEKEYTRLIVAEAERLEHILRDVLIFSRETRMNFERKNLDDIVKMTLMTFSGMLEEHSVALQEQYSSDYEVFIDTEQVRQAIMNVISNAVDAMPDGGTLTVRTVHEDMNCLTYVAVHIIDTGTGIQGDDLGHMFEPFHTTKEIGKGTGLGLSISRKIMEEHGGFISAKNNEDRGLTVSLCFPYQGREADAKTPCWEFMRCGRNANSEEKCPAFPHFGRVCWAVAGTFCQGKVQGTFAQKSADCRECPFYKRVAINEEHRL